MDDLDEVKVFNKDYGKYCLVSCWTDIEIESIPMWNIYANASQGVRIKMPILPFEVYEKDHIKYIIHPEEIIKDNYYFEDPVYGKLLKKVTYNNIKEVDAKKNGDITIKGNEIIGYDSCLAGSYKNDYWEFQSEWRYMLRIIPTKERVNNIDKRMDNKYISTLPEMPIYYKDLLIDKEKFKQMEITLGPRINQEDEKKINRLVEMHNPNAKILYSQLYNKM